MLVNFIEVIGVLGVRQLPTNVDIIKLTIFWIVLIEADLISHSNGEEVFSVVRECPNICGFVVWKVSHG